MKARIFAVLGLAVALTGPNVAAAKRDVRDHQITGLRDVIPSFEDLLAHPVRLRPELEGVHPRVFVTKAEIPALHERARTTHKDHWQRVLAALPATKGDPPPPPGPQERRSQNDVAFAIAGVSLAAVVEQNPAYLSAAKKWTLAAIDYEPWGYTSNKPNVDLAAGHLLYAIGWAYDLLYHDFTPAERTRIKASLERHARLVYDYFAPGKNKRFEFTQNHDFIPTSGLAVTALALLGESADAPKWAALARAHHHRAGQLLSPDGYYYESMEYWIFSSPWLVHFLDAWEHSTGESLWDRDIFRNWKLYLAHSLLPDGQTVFDFGDIWEGSLTRAQQSRRVLDAPLARSGTKGRATECAAVVASFSGLGCRVRPHVVGEERDGVRIQVRPARGPPRGGAPATGPGVAVEQRTRAARRQQLHHLG